MVSQFQEHTHLSTSFYRKRKLILILNFWRDYSKHKVNSRLQRQMAILMQQERDEALKRNCFRKMKAVAKCRIKQRNALDDLAYKVFYQWRLYTRLKRIKK